MYVGLHEVIHTLRICLYMYYMKKSSVWQLYCTNIILQSFPIIFLHKLLKHSLHYNGGIIHNTYVRTYVCRIYYICIYIFHSERV